MDSPPSIESDVPLVLPDVFVSDRSERELLAYFDEVLPLAPSVQVKSVLASFESGEVSAKSALDGILRGSFIAVQLRYRWEGQDFIDTVLRSEAVYRIIRMAT